MGSLRKSADLRGMEALRSSGGSGGGVERVRR